MQSEDRQIFYLLPVPDCFYNTLASNIPILPLPLRRLFSC